MIDASPLTTGDPVVATAAFAAPDVTAPTGYSISGVSVDNLTDEINFQIDGAEVGASYDVIVSSDGGGTDVTTTGSVTAATEFIGPLDISGLGYGTLTVDVVLIDASFNSGDPVVATAAFAAPDVTAPTGYSISGVSVDNLTDEINFQIDGAEVGATYDVIVSSDGGGTDVTTTGSVTAATEFIGPLDISGLGYGTLTVDVVLIDASPLTTGDPVVATAAFAAPDVTAPTGYSISGVSVDNLTDEINFQIDGAEVGASYDVIVSSDGGGTDVTTTGSVTAATEFIGPLDISGLGYGTLTS